MQRSPLVGVVMGSKSDFSMLEECVGLLREFEIPFEARVVSAHRTPDWLFRYAEEAEARGLRVIIAAAGGAVPATLLQGVDSLLSIVQMPKGIPVGTLAIGRPGGANAALLAAQILAGTDEALREKLRAWRKALTAEVMAQELPQ
jgi:5-(carboxyamino)imidazole ribonucleotide mutase